MNLLEFKAVVKSLALQQLSGRHLFFVREAKDEILKLLRDALKQAKQPANHLQILSVDDLAESLPNSKAGLQLEEKIRQSLEEIRRVGTPQFLVITDPTLLARYQIGLLPFYEHYLGDGTCAIVVLPSIPSQELLDALPNCVVVDIEAIKKPFPEIGRAESPLIGT